MEAKTKAGPKLRVNMGAEDWQIGMTIAEFEEALSANPEFLYLPRFFCGEYIHTVRVRPQYIRLYYEEYAKND